LGERAGVRGKGIWPLTPTLSPHHGFSADSVASRGEGETDSIHRRFRCTHCLEDDEALLWTIALQPAKFWFSTLVPQRLAAAMSHPWIADRMHKIDASGIRKVFDLAANMKNPINLSIGQPHFDTPEVIKEAAKRAIDGGRNAYSQTQGILPLINKIQQSVEAEYHHADRKAFVTSGTSGALMLALECLVNPGDEVIAFDPWFVMYKHLTTLAGGTITPISTYPDFRIDLNKVRDAITPRTKVILFNSPSNPTGTVATEEEVRGLAELAREKNVCLISDEIYRAFCYDRPFVSPAKFNDQTLVIDGFSKSHSMTGWRVGWAHGPEFLIQQMAKLQQFTFVCAPHPFQWAGAEGWDLDITPYVADYKRKRDLMAAELKDHYEIIGADGAFYMFIKAPWGTATDFVKKAIENELLIIPGNVFSSEDTHFRLSYAAKDETLLRGAEVLRKIAKG
jgi:aspartate aminotransferase